MQELTVVGVEDGSLVAEGDDGERYRIPVDALPGQAIRRSTARAHTVNSPKVSPREIQGYIRAGMSAADVAGLTGADLEDIERFEGPILAEREHIVASALGVPVHLAQESDAAGEATFGAVIRHRLGSLSATGERWASWKEPEGGWVVKLAFTSDEIDHDARWGFDPRRQALTPMNSEATTLSQQGELQGALIPRLRVVAPSEPDESRFDSGAFTFVDDADVSSPAPSQGQSVTTRGRQSGTNSIAVNAIKRSGEDQEPLHQTADLLDALRKRRGEREAAHASRPESATAGPRLVDVPLEPFASDDDGAEFRGSSEPARGTTEADPASQRSTTGARGAGKHGSRNGRASMPSWDEIVFGARTDDDLA